MEQRSGDFVVYGGVVVPAENAKALSEDIRIIRQSAGIAATERVKFLPPAPPCDHHAYIAVKQAIIEAAIKRSEEHTSELQSLMRSTYAVFCLKKKKQQQNKI